MRLGGFAENGQFLMLFMVALLFIWLTEDVKKQKLWQFALVILLLLLCPLTVKLLLIYQTGFYQRENLWELLPLTAVLAYGLVQAGAKIKTEWVKGRMSHGRAVGKREKGFEAVTAAIFAILLFLCGTLTFAEAVTAETEGTVIPQEVSEVLDYIGKETNYPVSLLAPDEVAEWARIYNGNITLPYGRSLWEPALAAYTYDTYTEDMTQLHDWVNGCLPPIEETDSDTNEEAVHAAVFREEAFLSNCASYNYQYLVFSTEREAETALKTALERQTIYLRIGSTDTYVIYANIMDNSSPVLIPQ